MFSAPFYFIWLVCSMYLILMIGMERFYKHLFDVGNVLHFFSAELSIENDIEYSASPGHSSILSGR